QPAELAGILTGVLLVATIILDRLSTRARTKPRTHINAEENELKNSQIAVLSGVILVAALIVTGSNWMLISSLRQDLRNVAGSKNSTPARKPVIAMMPKAKGDPYFISCKQGADEAAKELGVELLWDGPTDLDP